MANFNVSYIIEAIDQFSEIAIKIRESMSKLDAKAVSLSTRFMTMGKTLNKVGKNLSLKMTLPLAIVGGMTLKVASDFQHSSLIMQGALNLSQRQLEGFRKAAIHLGETTIFRARQVMNGMKLMAYSGVRVGQIMSVAAKATEFATANELDYATASVLVSKIMVAFKKDASALPKIMDTVTQANLMVAGSASDIAIPLGYAALAAKQAKMSFGDLAASLLIFRRAGVQASRSGTIMRKILTRLQAPIKTTKEFYKALGLNMQEMTQHGIKFNKILEIAAKRHFGVGKAAGAAALIFGQRAGPAFQALVNNIGQLKLFERELSNTGGVMDRIAKKQLAGLYGATKILASEWEHLQLMMLINPSTMQTIRSFEMWLGRINKKLADSKGPWKTIIMYSVMFLAALGPVLFMLGKIIFVLVMLQKIRVFSIMANGFMFLLSPVGLLLVGIGLLVLGFYELYKHSVIFRDVIKTMGKILYYSFLPVYIIFKTIVYILKGIGKVLYYVFHPVYVVFKTIYEIVSSIITAIKFLYHLGHSVGTMFAGKKIAPVRVEHTAKFDMSKTKVIGRVKQAIPGLNITPKQATNAISKMNQINNTHNIITTNQINSTHHIINNDYISKTNTNEINKTYNVMRADTLSPINKLTNSIKNFAAQNNESFKEAMAVIKAKMIEKPITIIHSTQAGGQTQTVNSKLDINVHDPEGRIKSISSSGDYPVNVNLGQNMALSSI